MSTHPILQTDNARNNKVLQELIKLKLRKYTRSRKLSSKDGMVLKVSENGDIYGSCHNDCKEDVMQVISIGTNMIALWGRESKKYVAVNENGIVYGADTEGRDCVFFERFTRTFYNVYESYHSHRKPSKLYLSMQNDGKVVTFNKMAEKCLFYWEILNDEE